MHSEGSDWPEAQAESYIPLGVATSRRLERFPAAASGRCVTADMLARPHCVKPRHSSLNLEWRAGVGEGQVNRAADAKYQGSYQLLALQVTRYQLSIERCITALRLALPLARVLYLTVKAMAYWQYRGMNG